MDLKAELLEKSRHVAQKSYGEIQVGDKAQITKEIRDEDILTFAKLTGDVNPVHIDDDFAQRTMFKERIAHGMLSASFISTVLGTQLPGTNTIYLSQNLKFKAPVKIGDIVTAIAEVVEKRDDKKIIKLKTNLVNQNQKVVVEGEAVIMKME
ncbi:MaoC family dehydratase [Aneurinibacillus sp. Ricciae_BoGa-3]|uniref:MaoC family dehydratase n=1 Tax=Aneurinibacillus sp. Ricciae_BoGa-3 TaxID=3022697 RepID=UPI00233FFEAE|nr:MaoC family dehydratase [Aneurinibacillus sp. Ricciae_BoGa-3]WCK55817.1 MaoC family dehydratase [Aneurinibacillus sp. Ricciae_BoGa-3]